MSQHYIRTTFLPSRQYSNQNQIAVYTTGSSPSQSSQQIAPMVCSRDETITMTRTTTTTTTTITTISRSSASSAASDGVYVATPYYRYE